MAVVIWEDVELNILLFQFFNYDGIMILSFPSGPYHPVCDGCDVNPDYLPISLSGTFSLLFWIGAKSL